MSTYTQAIRQRSHHPSRKTMEAATMTTRQLLVLTWILHALLIVALTFTPTPDSLYIMVQALFVLRFTAWAVRTWGAA